MPHLSKRRSRKSGMPPGSLVHIGDKKSGNVKITVIDYDEEHFETKTVENVEECFPFKNKSTITWINVDGIHDVEVIKKLGEHYGLHPLVQEDILNTSQRPKLEDFGSYIYIVLKMFHYYNDDNIVPEQISLVLGQNFVISFQEGLEGDAFDSVRKNILASRGCIRKVGSDFLVYSLVDAIVDDYFNVLEKSGEKIDILEEAVVNTPTQDTFNLLHSLKRELIILRKGIWPLREVIHWFDRVESSLIQKPTIVYIKDVYDHTIQVIDEIEAYRDIIAGMMDIYLSSINNRLSQIMKVLTVIATIFMPLTFLAGVYGMNFKFMPELEWAFGYPVILSLMAAIAVLMLIYFKKRKWI